MTAPNPLVPPRDASRTPGRLGGSTHRFLPVALLTSLTMLAGCSVTKDQVKEWGRDKDAFRLGKVVRDSRQSIAVRTEAALQLVDLTCLYRLEQALDKSSRADRRRISANLVAKLLPRLTKKNLESAEVIKAKDGLFTAWYFAPPKVRRRVEETIVTWLIFGDRGSGHDHSVPKILDALGRRGGDLLAEQTPLDHPQLYLFEPKTGVSSHSLLGMFRHRASARVRAETLKRYIAAARKDKKLALARNANLLCAIGILGGAEGARFLAELLSRSPDASLKAGASFALRVLVEADPKLLGPEVTRAIGSELTRIYQAFAAGKPPTFPRVRRSSEVAWLGQIIERQRDRALLNLVAPVVAAPRPELEEEVQRFDAMDIRLIILGYLATVDAPATLKLAFEKLPVDAVYLRQSLHDRLLKKIVVYWSKNPSERGKLLATLRQGTKHKSPVAQLIGVEGLGEPYLRPRTSTAADSAALKALVNDDSEIKGPDWQGDKLGARAKKALANLPKTR